MPTNFLWYSGQSANNGQLIPATTVMTTEMGGLAASGIAVSTIAGSSGIFTNSTVYTAQAILAEMFVSLGSPATTAAFGTSANLAGWFLPSWDGGTTFEYFSTGQGTPPARPPDFIFPLPSTTTSTNPISNYKAAGLIPVPALPFKVLIQNNSTAAFYGSSNTSPSLRISPIAMQY